MQMHGRDGQLLVNRSFIQRLQRDVGKYDILYLFAPLGWEKESCIAEFCRQYEGSPVIRLDEIDAAGRAELREQVPRSGKRLFVVSCLEQMMAAGEQELLIKLLSAGRKGDVFLLASAVTMPEQLLPYTILNRSISYGIEDLKPSAEDVAAYLKSRGVTVTQEECLRIERDSENLPLYIMMLANLLSNTDKRYSRGIKQQCFEDVNTYIDVVFFRTFSEKDQNALLKLSFFEEIDHKLVAYMLDMDSTEVEQLIERLLSKSSVLYKSRSGWRFQRLMKQFLERAIQKYLDYEERQTNYRKAMNYLLKQKNWHAALQFAYILQEKEQMACCLEQLLANGVDYNRFVTLERYFRELSADILLEHPELMISGSILKAIVGDVAASLRHEQMYLQYLEQITDAGARRHMERNLFRMYLSRPGFLGRENIEKSMELLENLQYDQNENTPVYEPQYLSVIRGEKDYCRYLLPEAGGGDILDKMRAAAAQSGSRMSAVLLQYMEAEVLYERNELDKALDGLVKTMKEANLSGNQRMQQICTLAMVDLLAAKNQMSNAEALQLEKLEPEQAELSLFAANGQAHMVYYHLLKCNTASVLLWLKEKAPDENERFYTTQYYQYLIKARVYIWLEQYVRARMVLELLLDFAEEYRMEYLGAQARILKAVIYYREGNAQWRECLMPALEWGRQLDFVRIFADEGAAVYELLSRLAQEERGRSNDPFYRKVLTAAKAHMLQYPKYLKPEKAEEVEAFTASEQDVMRLLVLGEKNAEIAKQLFVSENTVKYHLKNIYLKLQVKSRSQAIHKIRENGLI